MNMGEINHWNAVNSLFKRCICVATVQALLLGSSFVTEDRRLLSKQSINFKFKIVIHHCHNRQATIVRAVFYHSVDLSGVVVAEGFTV